MADELNFSQLMQTCSRGTLLDECNQKLNELLDSIGETGKGGSFNLKLSIGIGKSGHLEVVPDVSVKKPERKVQPGIFFLNDQNRLTRRDPRQMDIEDEIERRRAIGD